MPRIATQGGMFGYGRMPNGEVISTIIGSLYFDGLTSQLLLPNNDPDFQLQSSDFTVEWYQYMKLFNTLPRVFSIGKYPNTDIGLSYNTTTYTTSSITQPGDLIVVWPSTNSTFFGQGVVKAIDQVSSTKYAATIKLGSGFVVKPTVGQTVVTQLFFITADNLPECDPIRFTLEGTNDTLIGLSTITNASNNVNYTTIVADQPTNCSTDRLTKSFSATFENDVAYSGYRIRFTRLRNEMIADRFQIAEVGLLGTIVSNQVSLWVNRSTIITQNVSSIYDRWSHLAITRSTNRFTVYQDGNPLTTLLNIYNLTNSTNSLCIGTSEDGVTNIAPAVTTTVVTNLTGVSFSSGGDILSRGSDQIIVRGIVWNTSPNPTVILSTRTTESGVFGTGSFGSIATGLLPQITYYVRAYATSYQTTGYGNQITITTPVWTPVSTVFSASDVSAGVSVVTVNIFSTGGYTVTQRGIVWDTNPNPTISLSTKVSETGSFSSGSYTLSSSGMNADTIYYIRGFTVNQLGTSYSSDFVLLPTLYPFSAFTFTPAGATGINGPTLSQCRTAYSSATWTQNSAYFNMTTQGIQIWTVPRSAQYRIDAMGANGGSGYSGLGGFGARMTGSFNLVKGDKYCIVVGQSGTNNTGLVGGGGGATFVVKSVGGIPQLSDILLIAGGGGGGAYQNNATNRNATIADPSQSGWDGNSNITLGNGQSNGNGGLSYGTGSGGGGGGFIGNGGSSTISTANTAGKGGFSYRNGCIGGSGTYAGGFGGGGSGDWNYNTGAGGGGGFSGGSGAYTYGSGGGGSSINNGIGQTNTAGFNNGAGQVTFAILIPPTMGDTTDISSIAGTTAVSGGNVLVVGGFFIATRGVAWSTAPTPTIDSSRSTQSGTFSTGSFTANLTGLLGFTTYYVRSYAITDAGAVGYGTQLSFRTLRTAPVVSTVSATGIINSASTVVCEIVAPGDEGVTTRGIVWDTSQNPTIALSTKTVEIGLFQAGQFTATATPITVGTTYFIRAYATNSQGTSYGTQLTTRLTPDIITPMALWLDAQDTNTITLSGSSVTQWLDKSGNNRHASPAPESTSIPYSNNAMVLNGSNRAFQVNLDFMAGQSHSAFFVLKNRGYASIYGALNGGNSQNSLHVGWNQSSSQYRINYWGNDYYPNVTAAFKQGQTNLVNFDWTTNGKAARANANVEGTSGQTGTIGTMSGGGRIGNVTGQGWLDADINEVIVILNENITDLKRSQLEGFLAWKWGIQGNLPSNHPYKNSPP